MCFKFVNSEREFGVLLNKRLNQTAQVVGVGATNNYDRQEDTREEEKHRSREFLVAFTFRTLCAQNKKENQEFASIVVNTHQKV